MKERLSTWLASSSLWRKVVVGGIGESNPPFLFYILLVTINRTTANTMQLTGQAELSRV